METVRKNSLKHQKEMDVRVAMILWLVVAGICLVLANALAATWG